MSVGSIGAARVITPARTSITPSTTMDGKELKSLDELKSLIKVSGKDLHLSPGASFLVYVPDRSLMDGPATYLEGFNKSSPFSAKAVAGKPAPIRTPGNWIEVSAEKSAKTPAENSLKFVDYLSHGPPTPPAKTTRLSFTLHLRLAQPRPFRVMASSSDPVQRISTKGMRQTNQFVITGTASNSGTKRSSARLEFDGKVVDVGLNRGDTASDTAKKLAKALPRGYEMFAGESGSPGNYEISVFSPQMIRKFRRELVEELPRYGVNPDTVRVTVGGKKKTLRQAILQGDKLTS